MTEALSKGERATETRKRILDAAASLFRGKGYAAVSLRGIADAAAMKAGSVYYHFKSKEEIVLEVLNLGIERVHTSVAEIFDHTDEYPDAESLLTAAICAHLQTLLEHTDYTSANVRIYGQVPENIRSDALIMRRRYEVLWDTILTEAGKKGGLRADLDRRMFRLMLIGSLNATLEWFDPKQGSAEELSSVYASILLKGLMER